MFCSSLRFCSLHKLFSTLLPPAGECFQNTEQLEVLLGTPWCPQGDWPVGCPPFQLLLCFSCKFAPQGVFKVVPACMWFSLSSLRLPGWLHPLYMSLFSSTWLIPVGGFRRSMPNQIHPWSVLLRHSAHWALFRFCFSLN